jgi:glutamine amidotransferase
MRASGCAEALVEAIGRGAKVLGICVGLQMLFERGEEHGGATGLGLVPGTIARLPDGVKLPHIGWSPVRATGSCHPLFRPLDGEYVYFAHSFAAPAGARGAALLAHHGRDYCAALADGNVFAVQFHPEKSQKVGLALLQRFVQV